MNENNTAIRIARARNRRCSGGCFVCWNHMYCLHHFLGLSMTGSCTPRHS